MRDARAHGRMPAMNELPHLDFPAARESDFLDGLRREELRVNAAELAGNPFEVKGTWKKSVRATGVRGWTAGALAVAVLMLAWHLRPAGSSPDAAVIPVSDDGVVRLTDVDPRSLRIRIVDELRAAGVQVSGYEQLGVNGVDADLPLPVPPAALAALTKHRLPAPADGALRIEITSP